MSELDLLRQFRSNVPEPSTDAWLRAQAAVSAARAEAADAPPSRRSFRLMVARHRRRSLAALASATGAAAAVVTALVLTAGAAPSVAQAFPILAGPTTDLHSMVADREWAGSTLSQIAAGGDILQHAHPFPEPYGTGYVLGSPDGQWICLFVPQGSGPHPSESTCGLTADVEHGGALLVRSLPDGGYYYVALVPAGGSLTVTANGTTTSVPIDSNGIATGTVNDSATLTVNVGGVVTTEQVGPAPS
jgi:hypothetical protein